MAKIDSRQIIPPEEYSEWTKQLVADLNKDEVGFGVEHVRIQRWDGPRLSGDQFIRFKDGSDGHSAIQLRFILDQHSNPIFMKFYMWPAYLRQGQDSSEVD